jgi:hypothetical protein
MENFDGENQLRDLVDIYEDGPALPSVYEQTKKIDLVGEVLAIVASANATVPLERKVGRYEAMTLLQRSLERTMVNVANPHQRAFVAIREVSDFVNVATTGADPKVSEDYLDLLPIGHPQSTRSYEFSAEVVKDHTADWVAADPRIAEEFRPLVASAYKTPMHSVERSYALAKLEATSPLDVPRDIVLSLDTEADF